MIMIKHIVCFKLKDKTKAQEAKNVLLSMKGKVSEILEIEVGCDFLHSERSYDVILSVLLKDKTALNDYQNNPYHCDVVKKYMHEVRESSIAVDYEV